MKQIEATILGQTYLLACPPDGEALLREAVGIVDREMSAIRDAGKVKARERIAVLTALPESGIPIISELKCAKKQAGSDD